ncbi:histidine kinase [Nocardia sp. NPDC048505]|uniref:sensor histidine kinase n=1 Tax=Nocardia sp. NPDC048505 TaxID=3155756 RepID=UPI0033C66229
MNGFDRLVQRVRVPPAALVFGATLALAVAVFAIVLHTLRSDTSLADRSSIGLALIQALAVVAARRLPLVAWGSSIAAVVLATIWTGGESWVDAMTNSYLLVLGVIALTVPVWASAACWAGTVAVGVLVTVVLRPDDWLSELLELGVLAGLVLVAGAAVRGLLAAHRSLRAEQAAVIRQRERTALLEERARIARELHDVVAHHMSVIAIQAETAPFREPETMPQTFAAIRTSAVTALGEMRRILGVLRADDTGVLPQPTLTDLEEMAAAVRATGTRVELRITGDPAALPTGLGLSGYRIVQEAVSNAVRHAPGRNIRIEIDAGDDCVRLRVDNQLPATVRVIADGLPGFGLTGMRERANAFGGQLTAGPADDGWFRVTATLPIGE